MSAFRDQLTMNVALSGTRSVTGGMKNLFLLFFPLAAVAFSNNAYVFIEKLFLVRLSTANLEAAINSAYACQPFQGAYVAIVMMAQVHVGRCCGALDWKGIGPGIWQFIWFCLLSTVITIPLGILYGNFYFRGTEIENLALPYYYFLLGINFLFPLTITLASFYVGQGKTRLVLWATLGSQIVKIGLAYVLILGWKEWIPALGLLGGALSTLIAQGGLCLVLGLVFLKKEYAERYHTRHWQFHLKKFWESIYPGLSRGACRVLTFLCWASVAHLMTMRGGDALLILSVGGTLFLFFQFIADAVLQTQTTIASQLIGAKHYDLLKPACRQMIYLVLITITLMAIPCLIFPQFTFHVLFGTIFLEPHVIGMLFLGVWLSLSFFIFSWIPISHVFAFKDVKYFLFMGFFNWFNGYLLMYIAMDVIQIKAEYFWPVLAIMHASNAFLYYFRMWWLEYKVNSSPAAMSDGSL